MVTKDKILTRIMIGSVIAMGVITLGSLSIIGIEHANEPVPPIVNIPMMILGTVFISALLWFLIIWSGLTQKPTNSNQKRPEVK